MKESDPEMDAILIVEDILILLEKENPMNCAQNIMSRVHTYLFVPEIYHRNRERWGSTVSEEA